MAKKNKAPPRTIETLDQILAALVEYRVGLERVVTDPKEREDALAATDEIAKNLRNLRDDRYRTLKKVESYARSQRRKAKAEVSGSPDAAYPGGCADGALEALKILEG